MAHWLLSSVLADWRLALARRSEEVSFPVSSAGLRETFKIVKKNSSSVAGTLENLN